MTQYQVVGQCAHVTTYAIDGGRQTELLYKGAIVPQSATEKEIEHLLSLKLIEAVGGELFGTHEVGAVAGGDVRTGLDGKPVQSDEPGVGQPLTPDEEKAAAELADRRYAAQAKLTELGGKVPDGRASQPVLVEWLTAQGGAYDDLAKAEKSELLDLIKQRQQS